MKITIEFEGTYKSVFKNKWVVQYKTIVYSEEKPVRTIEKAYFKTKEEAKHLEMLMMKKLPTKSGSKEYSDVIKILREKDNGDNG
jgi:hypothetical protein